MSGVQLPTSRQAVVEMAANKAWQFTVPWYRFFGALLGLAAPSGADAAAITVTASPFSYTATNSGTVLVAGGTVSAIELGRNGVFTSTGVTAGVVPVSEGDAVRVTYTVVPTMTFVRH
jgi:hypothetical protein